MCSSEPVYYSISLSISELGGVGPLLSPMEFVKVVFCPQFYLLSTWMSCLLAKLQSSNVGCYWGHHFVGALAYADDGSLYFSPVSYAFHL